MSAHTTIDAPRRHFCNLAATRRIGRDVRHLSDRAERNEAAERSGDGGSGEPVSLTVGWVKVAQTAGGSAQTNQRGSASVAQPTESSRPKTHRNIGLLDPPYILAAYRLSLTIVMPFPFAAVGLSTRKSTPYCSLSRRGSLSKSGTRLHEIAVQFWPSCMASTSFECSSKSPHDLVLLIAFDQCGFGVNDPGDVIAARLQSKRADGRGLRLPRQRCLAGVSLLDPATVRSRQRGKRHVELLSLRAPAYGPFSR